jgi:hypothetical protein
VICCRWHGTLFRFTIITLSHFILSIWVFSQEKCWITLIFVFVIYNNLIE